MYQNLWATAKAILRWSYIYLNSYIRIEGRTKINFLNVHFKKVEKRKNGTQKSRRKEI